MQHKSGTAKIWRDNMLFVLDIMQVTFVTKPNMDLLTTSFSSQGMGTQTKTSNAPKHVPT